MMHFENLIAHRGQVRAHGYTDHARDWHFELKQRIIQTAGSSGVGAHHADRSVHFEEPRAVRGRSCSVAFCLKIEAHGSREDVEIVGIGDAVAGGEYQVWSNERAGATPEIP